MKNQKESGFFKPTILKPTTQRVYLILQSLFLINIMLIFYLSIYSETIKSMGWKYWILFPFQVFLILYYAYNFYQRRIFFGPLLEYRFCVIFSIEDKKSGLGYRMIKVNSNDLRELDYLVRQYCTFHEVYLFIQDSKLTIELGSEYGESSYYYWRLESIKRKLNLKY